MDLATFEEKSSTRRLVHAREDLDQRRFAGAVVAEQTHHLAPVDAHRNVVERDNRVEELGNVLDLNQWRHAVGVGRGHGQAFIARSRTKRLTSTEPSNINPRTTWNQSASMRANTMPWRTIPKMSAPRTAPMT